MGPGTGKPFPEQPLVWQPCLVFDHVRVAQRLERLDATGPRLGQAADLDQQIDDRFGSKAGYRRAPDVLDGDDQGTERVLHLGSLLVEHGRPHWA
jgi:hypothetical protein